MQLERLRVLLAAAVACTLAGCSAFQSNYKAPVQTTSTNNAVQAYKVTKLPEQNAHSTLAYPTGDRRTSCLLVEQVAPAEVRLGRECSYQVKLTNLTGEPVRGIVLRSRPMEGMRITSSSATTRPIGDGQIVYDIGDLAPHESVSVDLRALPDRLGRVEAAYAISTRPPVLTTAMNVVEPVLKISATGPADVDICQEIVHRYTVTNAGTGTARGVMIQTALPDGLTTADGKRVVTASLGDIPEGESRDLTARLKATHTGRFSTQAVARSRDDAVRAEAIVTAAHAPVLAVAVKGPEQETAGQPVVYAVTVTNSGDAPARNAMLRLNTSDVGQLVSVRAETDAGPGEPQLASSVVDITSNALGTLEPGQTRRVEVTTQAAAGGTLSFDATASAPCAKETRAAARTRILPNPVTTTTTTSTTTVVAPR